MREKAKDKRGRRLAGKALRCLQVLGSFLSLCALMTGVLYGRKAGVTAVVGLRRYRFSCGYLSEWKIYRLYGIPARYASGYVVQPEDFQEQEGLWRALVTDGFAHAWVEIFLEDYGWKPVEMAPDTEGQISAFYPGFDSMKLRNLAESFQQKSQDGVSVETGQRETERQQREEEGYSVIFDVWKYREIYLMAGSCLFCFLLFLLVLVDYLRRRQKLERMGCRKAYVVMVDILHGAGYFPEMEGEEKDFPETVARKFPELEKDCCADSRIL